MAKSTLHLAIDGGPKKGETLARRPGAAIRIGRVVRGNTIAIRDPSISSNHLSIQFDHQISRWAISDLGTSNGTEVNGVRVAAAAAFPLSDGDAVKIGENTLISVRIVVDDEEGVPGSKRVGRRGGSVRVSKKDEILDSVHVEDAMDVPMKSRSGRRGNRSRDSESDMVIEGQDKLGRALNATRALEEDDISDPCLVVPKNLRRGRRGNCFRDLKEDEVPGNLKRGRRKRGNSSTGSVLKTEQVSDTVIQNEIEGYDRLGKGLHSTRSMELDLPEDGTKVVKNLPRGKRGKSLRVSKTNDVLEPVVNCSSNLKEDETMDAALVHSSEMPVNLERERRKKGKSDSVSKTDQNSDTVVEDDIKALENWGRGLTNSDLKDGKEAPKSLPKGRRGDSSRVLKTSEGLDMATAYNSVVQERTLSNVSQKGKALVPVVEGSFDAPKVLGRGRSARTQVIKKDEVLNPIAEDKIKGPEGLRRGRSRSNTDLKEVGMALDSRIQVPVKVARKRSTRSKALKDGEALDSIVEDYVNVPKGLKRGVSRKNESLDSLVEDTTEDAVNLGRGKRRATSTRTSKKDDTIALLEESLQVPEAAKGRPRRAPDSIIQVPENVERKRSNRSRKVLKDDEVLDSIVEDRVNVTKDLKRGVSQKNESVDPLVEDTSEEAVNLGRGKRRATSTRTSKKEDTVTLLEESLQVPEAVKGKLRRAPARRTRAASAREQTSKKEDMVTLLEESLQVPEAVKGKLRRAPARRTRASSAREQLLESPLPKSPVLNPVENTYHHKELRGNSNQVGQNMKEFDKENCSKSRNSCSKQIPDEEVHTSGGVVANVAEPFRVFPKVWNGNGIPNSTSKYKEDSKVSWHATPFEERLEKVLSGEKLFP